MDMEQAAFWLAGCILLSLGIVILVVAGVIINNLLHTFWKPVKIFTPDSWKGFFPPHSVVMSQSETKSEPKLKDSEQPVTK